MVTLQILVLPFLVRVRVSQQKKLQVVDFNSLEFFFVMDVIVDLSICQIIKSCVLLKDSGASLIIFCQTGQKL